MVCDCFERSLRHISSGEDRRSLCPVDSGIGPGAQSVLGRSDVVVKRDMHALKDQSRVFYQTVAPAQREPTYVLVFLHGYAAHGDLYIEPLTHFVEQGAMVVLPDLPTWGRSDGLVGYFPDWWTYVDLIWEFLDGIVSPMRTQAASKPLKVFCSGHSLGGGLSACLSIMRPTFFDGAVLIAPMLVVGEEVKPPYIAQMAFKTLLGPWKLTWPLTPVKPMDGFDFRVASQGAAFLTANPLSLGTVKPRLASAQEMGFTFPEWMEAHLAGMRTPFLVLHGAADKITDPAMSKRFHDTAQATDKQVIVYEGAYHCELLCCTDGHATWIGEDFTPEQRAQTRQALADMSAWLSARA